MSEKRDQILGWLDLPIEERPQLIYGMDKFRDFKPGEFF